MAETTISAKELSGWPNARGVSLFCDYQSFLSFSANCYSYRPKALCPSECRTSWLRSNMSCVGKAWKHSYFSRLLSGFTVQWKLPEEPCPAGAGMIWSHHLPLCTGLPGGRFRLKHESFRSLRNHLLFGQLDLLEILPSIWVNVSNMAPQGQKGSVMWQRERRKVNVIKDSKNPKLHLSRSTTMVDVLFTVPSPSAA